MLRTPLALVPYLLAIAAVVGGLLWHLGDLVPRTGSSQSTGTAAVGGPFTLVDQTGAKRSDSDFRGRYRLVYFGYSFCPDICPATLGVIADTLDKLGGARKRIVPIFITLDPERDKPAVLKAYLKSFSQDFVGLTGSVDAIKKVASAYRVYYQKHPLPSGGYSVDHTSVLYLMDPNGKFVTFYNDESIGADALAADLKSRM